MDVRILTFTIGRAVYDSRNTESGGCWGTRFQFRKENPPNTGLCHTLTPHADI